MIEISQYTTRYGTGYQVSLTLSNMNGGSYTVIVGGVTGQPRTANGTLVETITAVDGSGLRIVASAGVTGFIDQVSMNAISIPSTTGITAGKAGTNNPVSTWRARRGSLVLNQPTASHRPILQGGGVVFDGVDDFYSGAAIPELSNALPWTIVMRLSFTNRNSGLLHNRIDSGNQINVAANSNTLRIGIRDSNGSIIDIAGAGGSLGLNINYLIIATWDGFSELKGRQNGSNMNSSFGVLSTDNNGLHLFSRSSTGSNQSGGTLKTLAIYNRMLSDAEILKIENYYNA